MRNQIAIRMLLLVAGTVAYGYYGVEFMTGSPAADVLAWWWEQGEGHVPILLCLTALLAFPFLLSLWIDTWIAIAWGNPVDYVFLGPTLEIDKRNYYAVDDPTQERLTIRLPSVPYGRTLTSRIDRLFAAHKMIRLGSDPRLVDTFMGHNTRSRSLTAVMHYVALFWGLAALAQIVIQYGLESGQPVSISYLLTVLAVSLSPLVAFHVLLLVSGHFIARMRFGACGEAPRIVHDIGLKPGDQLTVQLVKSARAGKNNLKKRLFLVEWPSKEGLMVTAVMAFYMNGETNAGIKELEGLAKKQDHIDCAVTEHYELRPLLFTEPQAIDWC
ncbi:hypothetical protein [Denitrobaculum tricleocarpae]|uniref:Uncharacterized protein n=1 Tax=Denitrobaculum tricleocarpae TaxID=2591009 RepID=A0A545TMM5_9PROT|nr:hypothetical protein [Denitrobaculum tricleocarpae]TQV78487.1 hypothetical protein FKG95_18165 [Denitrobaculum tricleocarpae]